MSATIHTLTRALDTRANEIAAIEQSGHAITHAQRMFCLRRRIRIAAQRAGRSDLERAMEQRALAMIADGASTAFAAARVIRECLPRN